MMKRKKNNLFAEPIFYLIISMIGLALIIFLPEQGHVSCNAQKIIAICEDIGTGFFSTGLVGVILVYVQRNQIYREKFNRRLIILRELDIALHNYLNEVCRVSCNLPNVNSSSVKQILKIIEHTHSRISLDDSLIRTIELLSGEITKIFNKNPIYLSTDIFNEKEIEALNIFNESISLLLEKHMKGDDVLIYQQFQKNINCMLKLFRNFPEFEYYLKLKFNGSHIK